MQDKSEFLRAIDDSGLLSNSQKNILKYIVSFDLKRGVPAFSIMEYMKISKQAVNYSLQQLMKRNFIDRRKDKVFIYTIHQAKLLELLEDYNQKKNLNIN
jgi:predicted transcriptional regulator